MNDNNSMANAQKRQKRLVKISQGAVVLVLLIYIGFPLFWAVTGAFKTQADLFASPPSIIFFEPTFQNFERLLFATQFPRFFLNSTIVAIGATILTTALATLGGYGLTRSNFKGQRHIARGVLFTYMFPPILLGIPLYTIFFNVGLLNSYFGLMLTHTAITLPFCLWIMWQYFQTIPISYEESAWISGANELQAFWDVALPMAKPGVVAVAIFAFALSWNDYTLALIIMTDSSMQTLPLGIATFVEQTAVHWGLILASGFIVMLPSFLLIFFLQKHLLRGFSVA